MSCLLAKRRPLVLAAVAFLAALVLGLDVWAQPMPSGGGDAAAATAPPEPIAPEDVLARAAETQQILRAIEARAQVSSEVEAVARKLDEISQPWAEQAAEALRRIERESGSTRVEETERVWSARRQSLAEWSETLGSRAGSLARDLAQLDRERELWERTRDAKRDEPLPATLRKAIARALGAIASTRGVLRERRDAVLALQSKVLHQQRRVTEVLERAGEARARLRSRIFVRDSPVLWRSLAQAQPAEAGEQIASAWEEGVASLQAYASEHVEDIAVFALCLAIAILAVTALGRRAARWAVEDEGFAAAARVLGRPVSASLLVLLIAYPLVLPASPLLLRWLAGVVVIVPALRLVVPLLEGASRRAVYLLSAWFAVDSLRFLLLREALPARILLLLEAAAALACLLWLLRPSRSGALDASSGGRRPLAALMRFAAVLLAVSLLSNLVGNSTLAEVLLRGTLLAAYVAFLIQGSARVFDGLWAVLLHTQPLRLLRGVMRHETLLRRRGALLVRWGLGFLWLWFTLGFFQLREPVWTGVVAALTTPWPIGNLELSLGDVVAFGIILWLALWLSRAVRFVLDEDVLPRAPLPRGVPYAISSATHYVILLIGFLLALSAAGFNMSNFALIVGALGVGIGIGLQEVVNNFVSGLILLFERPVQTGDTVQVGDLFGEVRRIGMRSSTVRTWSGAEVIVPNSRLVSDNVVNWTLSDKLRRVEVSIGVAYGTDPEQVLALLIDVARAHASVLDEPAPTAIFVAHGNSSLDFELRAWTTSRDWFVVKSDLTVAINRALRDAGIEIPFPQRDLHLRSVDPKVRDALSRGES